MKINKYDYFESVNLIYNKNTIKTMSNIKNFKKFHKLNEAHETSIIQRQFNNSKYIKGYKSYSSAYGNSFDITPTRFRIGDLVEVDLNNEKYGGKKGKIGIGFSKDNPNMLKVIFEEGKSALIEKTYLQKIAKEN